MRDFFAGVGIMVLGVVLIFGINFVMAIPVMYLWNWLIPTIFGVTTITYWQALGLTYLCGILFKGNLKLPKKEED